MLDKELWKLLPAPLPSIVDALAARTSSSDEGGGGGMDRSGSPGHLDAAPPGPPGDYAAFEAVVVQGNPWRKQQTPRRRRALAQLGFGGSAAGGADDGRAARQLEVDEYGMPLGPSPGGALGSAAPNRGGSAQSEGAGGGTSGSELIDLGEEASEVYGAPWAGRAQVVRASVVLFAHEHQPTSAPTVVPAHHPPHPPTSTPTRRLHRRGQRCGAAAQQRARPDGCCRARRRRAARGHQLEPALRAVDARLRRAHAVSAWAPAWRHPV